VVAGLVCGGFFDVIHFIPEDGTPYPEVP
jgi:hypothetical protein